MWICIKCNKKIPSAEIIKCPSCGYRLFRKERPPFVKNVQAV